MSEQRETFKGWAILELMGHRRLGGHVSEEVVAGAAFVRIDVPENTNDEAASPAATQFYAPAAVYCIIPTTEETARRVAEATNVAPVSEWDLPRRPALTAGPGADEELEF